MNASNLIAFGSFFLTLVSMLTGAMLWVRQKEQTRLAEAQLMASEKARKEVNDERNFNHLVRNYEQQQEALKLISDEVREVLAKLQEVETYLISAKLIDRRHPYSKDI